MPCARIRRTEALRSLPPFKTRSNKHSQRQSFTWRCRPPTFRHRSNLNFSQPCLGASEMKFTSTAAAAAIAFAATSSYSQELIVKIGHVAPTSGSISHLGRDLENGAKMAIEELNAQGVLIGGRKATFQLLTEDDAADPKQGTAAAQK